MLSEAETNDDDLFHTYTNHFEQFGVPDRQDENISGCSDTLILERAEDLISGMERDTTPTLLSSLSPPSIEDHHERYPESIMTETSPQNFFTPSNTLRDDSESTPCESAYTLLSNPPQCISDWAGQINSIARCDEFADAVKYSGRGCYSCHYPSHQPCLCKLVCHGESAVRALAQLQGNQRIIFLDTQKLQGRLDALQEQVFQSSGNKTLVDVPRQIQKLSVKAKLGQHVECGPFKLDPRNLMTLLDAGENDEAYWSTTSSSGVNTLVHIAWDDDLSENNMSHESTQQKLEFMTKKFICLWTLLAHFSAIEVVAASFDQLSFNNESNHTIKLEFHRAEVKRKRILVAISILSSLLHSLRITFGTLIEVCDAIGRKDQAIDKPPRALRICLRALIKTLEITTVQWEFNDSQLRQHFDQIRDLIQYAGTNLKGQLGLFECYSGYVKKTRSIQLPGVLQQIKTRDSVRCDLRLEATTTTNDNNSITPIAQVLSRPQTIAKIFSTNYVEMDPLDTDLSESNTSGMGSFNHGQNPLSTTTLSTQSETSLPMSSLGSSLRTMTRTSITSAQCSCTSKRNEIQSLIGNCSTLPRHSKRAASSSPRSSQGSLEPAKSTKRHRIVNDIENDGALTSKFDAPNVTTAGTSEACEQASATDNGSSIPSYHTGSRWRSLWNKILRRG